MERWRNKVAVVTGASSGIGAGIAEALTKEKVYVVGLSRNKDKLEELSEKLNIDKKWFYYFVTDVTKEEDILKAFDWIVATVGPIHILVNNAGIFRFTTMTNGDTVDYKDVLDTNLMGLCIATREAIKNMKKNHVDGHIIHINSTAGHKVIPNSQIYSIAKHGVTAHTEVIRQELSAQKSKIKVTSISPGHVRTNIVNEALSRVELQLQEQLKYEPEICLHPEDVGDTVLYVLSTPPHVQVHEIMVKSVGEFY